METHVFLAVLAAALLHAGWNALLKLKLEPLLAITLISIAAGIVSLPLIPFAALPNAAAWPYIAASLALHMIYYLSLGAAYREGDLSQVYPIARGTAPLITALGSALFIGEALNPAGSAGVAVLACGILLLSFKNGVALVDINWRPVGFALITAASISAYTLIDGIGARAAGAAIQYATWLFLLDGVMMLAFGFWRWPRTLVGDFYRARWSMFAGGAMSMAAYGIAIWAMTQAPIALVGALRETSVLFAAVIGIVVLHERIHARRIIAALLILAGMLLIRLR